MMAEPTLAILIEEAIRNLDHPDVIRSFKWDHPDTLNVGRINEAARKLGIGPIFEIGDASAWWEWPNLPANHPKNQVRVHRLTVFAPDGRAQIDILRFNSELRSGTKTAWAINKAVVSRLKKWEREARAHVRHRSQYAVNPVVSFCPQCGSRSLSEDANQLCKSCRTHRGKVAEFRREFSDINATLNGALFWPHSSTGEKVLAGEFHHHVLSMNKTDRGRILTARDRILEASGVKLGLDWMEPEKWEIVETIRQFIKPLSDSTPIPKILSELHGNLKSRFPGIRTPGSVTLMEALGPSIGDIMRATGFPYPSTGHVPTHSETEEVTATHSPDFASINWYGTLYELTLAQAAVIKTLWNAYEKGTPTVTKATLLNSIPSDVQGSNCEELSHLFRGHPAWKVVIFSPKKGIYRLAAPPMENHEESS